MRSRCSVVGCALRNERGALSVLLLGWAAGGFGRVIGLAAAVTRSALFGSAAVLAFVGWWCEAPEAAMWLASYWLICLYNEDGGARRVSRLLALMTTSGERACVVGGQCRMRYE